MDEGSGEGRNRDGLQPKPAPGPLALVQGFVNTRNIMHGYDLLEDVGGAQAWLVEHGLLDGGVRLTGAAQGLPQRGMPVGVLRRVQEPLG